MIQFSTNQCPQYVKKDTTLLTEKLQQQQCFPTSLTSIEDSYYSTPGVGGGTKCKPSTDQNEKDGLKVRFLVEAIRPLFWYRLVNKCAGILLVQKLQT